MLKTTVRAAHAVALTTAAGAVRAEMSTAGVFDSIFSDCDALIHTADGGYPHVTDGEQYLATNRHIIASLDAGAGSFQSVPGCSESGGVSR